MCVLGSTSAIDGNGRHSFTAIGLCCGRVCFTPTGDGICTPVVPLGTLSCACLTSTISCLSDVRGKMAMRTPCADPWVFHVALEVSAAVGCRAPSPLTDHVAG